MTEKLSLDQAAEAMREAIRDVVRRRSLGYMLQGALMVATGVVALAYPVFSSVAVVVLLGWLLIISGAVQAISLIGSTKVPYFWLQFASIVLSVLVGLLFISDPGDGLITLTFLLIVFFMVGGLAKVSFALTIRPFPNWGWVLASGAAGMLIAIVLWSLMPIAAAWILGLLVGVQLISEGAALAYMAWRVRSARE